MIEKNEKDTVKEDKKKQQVEQLYAQLGRQGVQKEELTLAVQQTQTNMQKIYQEIKKLEEK